MSSVDTAVQIANNIPAGDPVLDAAKWVFLVLALIGGATYPFLVFLRRSNKDKNENTIDTAIATTGSSLYNQLLRQVEEYRSIADKAYRERSQLAERIKVLEIEAVSRMQELKQTAILAAKLEQRESDIAALIAQSAEEREHFYAALKEKEAAINLRDTRILQLEQSVSALQLRLVRDEARQIFGAHVCPFAAAKAAGKKLPADIAAILTEHQEESDCLGLPASAIIPPPSKGKSDNE